MLGMVFALAALGSLAACGGGGGGGQKTTNPGTAAGTYVFSVSGTGSPTPLKRRRSGHLHRSR